MCFWRERDRKRVDIARSCIKKCHKNHTVQFSNTRNFSNPNNWCHAGKVGRRSGAARTFPICRHHALLGTKYARIGNNQEIHILISQRETFLLRLPKYFRDALIITKFIDIPNIWIDSVYYLRLDRGLGEWVFPNGSCLFSCMVHHCSIERQKPPRWHSNCAWRLPTLFQHSFR